MIRNILIIVAAISLLSGCADESVKQVALKLDYIPDGQVPSTTDANAQMQLASASNAIKQSMRQLSSIEMATHPEVKVPNPPLSSALARPASLNWHGPIQQAVSTIAKAANFRFHVLGKQPHIPVLITINETNKPLGFMLREAALQAAPNATIKTSLRQRLIELRYQPNHP